MTVEKQPTSKSWWSNLWGEEETPYRLSRKFNTTPRSNNKYRYVTRRLFPIGSSRNSKQLNNSYNRLAIKALSSSQSGSSPSIPISVKRTISLSPQPQKTNGELSGVNKRNVKSNLNRGSSNSNLNRGSSNSNLNRGSANSNLNRGSANSNLNRGSANRNLNRGSANRNLNREPVEEVRLRRKLLKDAISRIKKQQLIHLVKKIGRKNGLEVILKDKETLVNYIIKHMKFKSSVQGPTSIKSINRMINNGRGGNKNIYNRSPSNKGGANNYTSTIIPKNINNNNGMQNQSRNRNRNRSSII